MAYETGTASGHIDLLDKLKTFLTTNSALVAAGQQWQALRYGFGVGPYTWPYNRIAVSNYNGLVGRVGAGLASNFPDAIPDPMTGDAQIRFHITCTLNIPSAGSYTFGLDSLGYADILIDGNIVVSRVNSDPSWNITGIKGAVTLSAGTHTFEVRYLSTNATGGFFGLRVGIQPPGGSMANIDTTYLSGMQYSFDQHTADGPTIFPDDMNAFFAQKYLCLKGTGLGGTDNIYVNLFTSGKVSSDYYNLNCYFASSYDSTKMLTKQAGCSDQKNMLLWNQSMKYWFIANGRRFIVITKVSTVYEAMYGGLLLPYATPTEYPYPVAIGGSHQGAYGTRWSDQGTGHSSFWNPGWVPSLSFRDASGNVQTVSNDWSDGGWQSAGETYPYMYNPGYRPAPDGTYAINPVTIATVNGRSNIATGKPAVYGDLDGVYHVSGFNNSSESVITLGSENYLVVQSTFRNGINDYAAIHLA